MKYKKLMAIIFAGVVSVSMTACGTSAQGNSQNEVSEVESTSENSDKQTDGNGNRTGGMKVDKSGDVELQNILSEVVSKYKQLKFEDSETGKTLEYNLFIPENYDSSKSYPLLLFMPDSSLAGKGTEAALTQGYGGVIWATEAEQAKHESFVLVPAFSETIVNDNFEVKDEADIVIRLINSLTENYSIDKNRLYTTGQSMGCMTSMYFNLKYPDLFAASLYVGGQWDTSKMGVLSDTKFFYIVSEGDTKASVGMNDLEDVFKNEGAHYSRALWDATWSQEEFNESFEKMIDEGNSANMVMFKLGSVIPEGVGEVKNEHMYSFDYAYKIDAVRDWLFNQSK